MRLLMFVMLTKLVFADVFANTTNQTLDSRVFIRANYIQDVDIDLRGGELDFGDIFPGDKATIKADKYDDRKVEMRIKGEEGKMVQFIFPDSLPLYNDKGNAVQYTVDIREKFQDNKKLPSGTNLPIPEKNDETLILYIGGEVDSYTTTEPGNYTGDLYIKMRYDE